MSLVIGVDCGTSGLRAAAINEAGVCVAEAKRNLPPTRRIGPSAHQTPADWIVALEDVLDEIATLIDPADVAALAIDGTSGTVLGLDANHQPLGPARMYDDGASVETAKRITATAPQTSAAHGVTSGLAKAIDIVAETGAIRVVHQADYLAWWLADIANPVSDENNALKTGYDPISREWPVFIEALGLDRSILPPVVEPGTPLGRIRPWVSRRFGFDPSTILAAGTTDGCASFLATGAQVPGDAVSALGTTLTVKLLSTVPIVSPRHGVYSHRLGTGWLAGGASNTGGAALLLHFSAAQMAELEAELRPDVPTGLDYYPLAKPGERFPLADPALQPRVSPRPASDALFLQGLLEGIAAVEAKGYALLTELGGPPLRRVLSVGGGARNAPWTAIRARALGVPVLQAPTDEAAFGVAKLARMALAR